MTRIEYVMEGYECDSKPEDIIEDFCPTHYGIDCYCIAPIKPPMKEACLECYKCWEEEF